MQLPQVRSASALAAAHLPMVRAAIVAAGDTHSIGFVCDSADDLARELMGSYAAQSKRFGDEDVDGVHVFALSFGDAMTLLRAPGHAGSRETQTAIIQALWQLRETPSCVCFGFGAVVLIEAWGASPPKGALS